MKFIFVRHGQTNWNWQKRVMGWEDQELSEEGFQQVRAVSEKLPPGIDAIYSSPLKRAYQSAEIIGKKLGLPVVVKEELKERNFGSLTGKTWEEIQEETGKDLKTLDGQQIYDYRPWGGENSQQVKERLLRFIEKAKKENHKLPLVVAHGGIIRMLQHLFREEVVIKIANTAIEEFEL